jgi:hypothetical protein
LIGTAARHELLDPLDRRDQRRRRARLLAAMGKLDGSVYPAGYLDELRAERRY